LLLFLSVSGESREFRFDEFDFVSRSHLTHLPPIDRDDCDTTDESTCVWRVESEKYYKGRKRCELASMWMSGFAHSPGVSPFMFKKPVEYPISIVFDGWPPPAPPSFLENLSGFNPSSRMPNRFACAETVNVVE
jgi:hypothetical protein